jgi:hypothetical protein
MNACLPYEMTTYNPWGHNSELDRLRRLQRQVQEREEADRIRRWLHEHGVYPYASCPWVVPLAPMPNFPRPSMHKVLPLSVDDVLAAVRRSKR